MMPRSDSPLVYGVVLPDAGERWPGRNLLAVELAKHGPVVFLEQAPTPRWSPRRPRVSRTSEGCHVLRNVSPPYRFRHTRFLHPFLDRWQARRVAREFQKQGWSAPVLWLTVTDRTLLSTFPGAPVVYDCMDPNFLPARQADFDREQEHLARRATVVFASAHGLLRDVRRWAAQSVLLPNAADPGALEVDGLLAESWRERLALRADRPVVGYLGTVDWRVDSTFLAEVVEELSECDFVIAGRVNTDREQHLGALRRAHNVRFTGQLSYADGYAVNSLFDVGLIPFTPGEMNDRVNSVKMFMYLLTGKPVVSTWLEESRLNPLVSAARTPHEMASAIRSSLAADNDDLRRQRRDFGAGNTWAVRAAEALVVLRASEVWAAPGER